MNDFEKAQVKALGRDIGYGTVMDLASRCWRESLADSGSEFVVGPCHAETVPCGCEQQIDCAWCCGTGWLTQKVKEIKNALEDKEILKKQHDILEYGNYDPKTFKQFLDSSRSFYLCHTNVRSWGVPRIQKALINWVKAFEKLEESGK